MRLIDADALKDRAFGKRGGLIHTSDIDAMPTIEPKWIPCSEKMPSFGDVVLVTTEWDTIAVGEREDANL